MDYSYAARLDRAKSIISGMTANEDKLEKLGDYPAVCHQHDRAVQPGDRK